MEGSGVVSTGQAYSLEGANMTPASEYRKIYLTQDKVAIVDESDFHWLIQWSWAVKKSTSTKIPHWYAIRNRLAGDVNQPRRTMIYMARLIMGCAWNDGTIVDHVNGDTLDNRRINLRVVTAAQNNMNQSIRSNNRSGYKGVGFNKNAGKWMTRIKANGVYRYLGLYDTPEDAYKVYCEAAAKYHGEFARVK